MTEEATEQAERLWALIAKECDGFLIAHRSDLFELLATILAYYEARGTTPEQMIGSPRLRDMVAHLLTRRR